MLAVDKLNPPIQFGIIWVIIGAILILVLVLWYVFVFWSTRKKPIKSLASLKILPPPTIDLKALRAKYLGMIELIRDQYASKQISLRDLHLQLSLAIRLFMYEAKGFPAPKLTLGDIKKSSYKELSDLITDYYPEEFAEISDGTATDSVEAARGFINKWT